GARRPSGIVSRPVLTVTPWVAGVAHLGDLVIPDLGVGRVYHAETTAVHIEARTDTTQDVYFECRQGEARRVAARAPDASGIRLAPQDPRARRVWVPACDAGRMAAAGGRVFRRHRKHGLDGSGREGERLAVRDRERGLDAGFLPGTTMRGVSTHRITPGTVARTEAVLLRALLADV